MARKRTSLLPVVLLGIVAVIVAAGIMAYSALSTALKPVDPKSKQAVRFVVAKGQGTKAIGAKLEEKNLIRSSWAFRYVVASRGVAKNIQAGSFELSPSMTTLEVVEQLTHGTMDTWVTILEGWRREEIAASLKQTFAEAGADFNDQAFLKATQDKEGHLFPDTYLFPLNTSEQTVASILETTFNKKITAAMRADIEASGHTLDQVITMASLIEREARQDDSRKIVSGILWKRLAANWPLQVDASLQYAKGYDPIEKTWWKPPTSADKNVKSPYNTYANPGLPPAPICSPSLSSITAAIYPTSTNYWFYITDANGRMHYSETVEQHNQNVNTYLR